MPEDPVSDLPLSQPPLPSEAGVADTEASVIAYLRAHPEFLAERPDLYRSLSPPRRVHGEAMADHMAAMLRAERDHAQSMSARAASVLAAGRAAAGLTQRIHEAVLAVLRAARQHGDIAECVALELPTLLGVDGASLGVESETAASPAARLIGAGTVERLLGGRAVIFRTAPEDARVLHGEAAGLARRDALVRVPGPEPALLALVARDDNALDPVQGGGALAFLGRAIAAALGR